MEHSSQELEWGLPPVGPRLPSPLCWKADAKTLRLVSLEPVTRSPSWQSERQQPELRPTFLTELVEPRDRERMLMVMRSVAADGRGRRCVHRLVTANGSTRWCSTSIRAIRDGSERLLEGMTQPVRGLQLAWEEFLRHQAVLRRMLAQVPAFLYLTDRELRFIATIGADWAGLDLSLEGKLLHEVLGAFSDPSVALAAHQRALDGEPASYDTEWSHRPLAVRVEPAFDEEGQCVGTIGIAVDSSGRRREMEELRTSAERLRTLLETTPDSIYLKDGEGRWLEANDAGLHLFRLSRSEYQGLTDLELSRLNDFFREAFLACYSSDQQTWATGGPSRTSAPAAAR